MKRRDVAIISTCSAQPPYMSTGHARPQFSMARGKSGTGIRKLDREWGDVLVLLVASMVAAKQNVLYMI